MLFGIHRLTFANIALSLRRNQVNDSSNEIIAFLDGSFQLGSINQKPPEKRRPRKRK